MGFLDTSCCFLYVILPRAQKTAVDSFSIKDPGPTGNSPEISEQ